MAAVAAAHRRALLSRLLCFSPCPSSCGHLRPSIRSFAVSPSPQNPAAVSRPTRSGFGEGSRLWRCFSSATTVQELLGEVAREKQRERAEKKIAGVEVGNDDEEEDEDYMGVEKLIEKLEKQNAKERGDVNRYEEPTDSDSDEDEEALTAEKMEDEFKRKFDKHEELLQSFVDAENVDDAYKCMKRIEKFEEKHLPFRLEYRVIGELMNRLKEATGKDRFMLLQKLNRAMRLVQWKEAYDPNNPANYGVIQLEQEPQEEASKELDVDAGFEREMQGAEEEDEDEDDFGEKDKDDILREKLEAIDKKLEEKLALLDITFGKKGRALEEEIKDIAEERNALTEKARRPLYRKGFDVRLIDVKRTCKVTKGGQVVKYTAMLACGNYHGVIGYAKAKGSAVPIALQKAYEKCFQNLHYVERHEEHTIAHAIQTNYKKTKLYLWPAPTRTGMKASRTVEIILHLAGFKNIKSKVIGSRNPHNTVKAVFQALNAIETPKDVQEKFGRTVVESYLL